MWWHTEWMTTATLNTTMKPTAEQSIFCFAKWKAIGSTIAETDTYAPLHPEMFYFFTFWHIHFSALSIGYFAITVLNGKYHKVSVFIPARCWNNDSTGVNVQTKSPLRIKLVSVASAHLLWLRLYFHNVPTSSRPEFQPSSRRAELLLCNPPS